jgi:hypothetical protein
MGLSAPVVIPRICRFDSGPRNHHQYLKLKGSRNDSKKVKTSLTSKEIFLSFLWENSPSSLLA